MLKWRPIRRVDLSLSFFLFSFLSLFFPLFFFLFPFLFLLFWRLFSDPGARGPQRPPHTPLYTICMLQYFVNLSQWIYVSSILLTGYYFTPMILIGCLSIVSGVVVAYIYHHKTGPVPRWLRKLVCVRYSTLSRVSMINRDFSIRNANAEMFENASKVKNMQPDSYGVNGEAQLSNGQKVATLAYPTGAEGKVPLQRNFSIMSGTSQVTPERAQWREIASAIDHLLLALGIVLTFVAIGTTCILFAVSKEGPLE